MTTPTPIDPDAPVYEQTIPTPRHDVRATVDVGDAGRIYATLTVEMTQPPTGPWATACLSREGWAQLRSVCDDVLATMDAITAREEQAA